MLNLRYDTCEKWKLALVTDAREDSAAEEVGAAIPRDGASPAVAWPTPPQQPRYPQLGHIRVEE